MKSEYVILDIGCGTGRFTRRLASDTRARITGVAINAEWLEYAHSRDSVSSDLQADAMALSVGGRTIRHFLSLASSPVYFATLSLIRTR